MGFFKNYCFLFFLWCLSNSNFALITNQNYKKIEDYEIVSTLISYPKSEVNSTRTKRNILDSNCLKLSLIIKNSVIKLCLIEDNEVFSDIITDTIVTVFKNNKTENFNFNDINITSTVGYVTNKPYSSSVFGYIENHRFYGKINIAYRCYYVERVNKFPEVLQRHHLSDIVEDAIVYERSYQYYEDDFQSYRLSINQRKLESNVFNMRASGKPTKNKLCTLLVLIDNSFLRIISRGNIRESISIVLYNLQESNAIFRSTDFDDDGVPNNVGFIIKNIIVIESENGAANNLLRYSKSPISGDEYLQQFSRNRMLKNVCLGVAFTAQVFKKYVIGLSYTPSVENGIIMYQGGICERPSVFGDHQNCLVITYRSYPKSNLLPQTVTELSLAHELGHSFGADHDTGNCYGYLMSGNTFSDLTYKNFLFSECSKKKISIILKFKSFCMQNTNRPFCGNGIIENDEECDCGFTLYCTYKDLCCTPRGSKNSCQVNTRLGFECHPSQGFCCNSKCKYKDISYLRLSCKNFNKNNNCIKGEKSSCGVLGKCLNKKCQSNECARINLDECQCPPISLTNSSYCRTCCMDEKKKCLPAPKLTTKLLKDKRLFEAFVKNYSNENRNIIKSNDNFHVLQQNICFRNTCINIPFRLFKRNDYCLHRGKLGMCDDNFQCLLPDVKQIYPRISKINKGFRIAVSIYAYLFVVLVTYFL